MHSNTLTIQGAILGGAILLFGGFGGIGPWEMALIMMVLILVFGAKRLPEIGKSLGSGIKEFKKSISTIDDTDEKLPATKDDDNSK